MPVKFSVYVASRASVPDRPEMWRRLREQGWSISSHWIDEPISDHGKDFESLWTQVRSDIYRSSGLILYATSEDFPLKGALVEAGIAVGMKKRVAVVLEGFEPELPSHRPIGSWVNHPLCQMFNNLSDAYAWLEKHHAG